LLGDEKREVMPYNFLKAHSSANALSGGLTPPDN
jgi:hypothetical protein